MVILPLAGMADWGLGHPLDAEETVLMHVLRDACRLVDDQQMPVLENDRPLDQFEQAARGAAGLRVDLNPHRRQAYFVACLDPVLRIDALAIDAHFALAQQAINAAARHGFEVSHQEVIDALAGLIGGYGAHRQGTFRPAHRWQVGSSAVHCVTWIISALI